MPLPLAAHPGAAAKCSAITRYESMFDRPSIATHDFVGMQMINGLGVQMINGLKQGRKQWQGNLRATSAWDKISKS